MAEGKKNRKERKEKKDEPTAEEEKDIDKRVIDYWLAKGKEKEKRKKKEKRKGR
jgi:hypothetical protein